MVESCLLGRRALDYEAMIVRNGYDIQWLKANPCETSEYPWQENLYFTSAVNVYTLLGRTDLINESIPWGDENHSQIVVSSEHIHPYVRNAHYTINYLTGVVTRINLPLNTYLPITYTYQVDCNDKETRHARADCPQCLGSGVLYETPVELRAVIEIPKYEEQLTTAGYFHKGDIYIHISVRYGITAQEDVESSAKQLLRDKIIIDNKTWLVMAPPDEVRLDNELVAKKAHLRLLKKPYPNG